MRIRVAAAQLRLGKTSFDGAISDARIAISEAARNGANVVCLPEHWLLEYRDRVNEALALLVNVARRSRIFVVTGANYIAVDERKLTTTRVRSHLIDPNGRVLGYQDKVHLFRAERQLATPGQDFHVFETEFGRFGIAVCYDNVFPESSRTLALKGADILFVPSRIVREGIEPWLIYLKSRALENRIPIVAPNGTHPPKYSGGSVIIDLQVDRSTNIVTAALSAWAGEESKVIFADVDIEQARRLREERLAERQPKAYGR
jgi:predicted amidohydrolase